MKKSLVLILSLLAVIETFSQIKEGQNFCDQTKDGSYFPLVLNEKKFFWEETHYVETKNGTKELNGKTYIEYLQKWKGGTTSTLYLREKNGVVYQYEECCKQETIRYDEKFKKGHTWKTADNLGQYKILTFKGTLKTPFCEYKNLMVIQADLKNGTFKFYYLKGHGYIGATINDKIISCVTPTFDLD